MANLSAMGVRYTGRSRLPSAALLTSASSRTAPRRMKSCPTSKSGVSRAGQTQRAPGTRDYEFMVAVLGTDKMKTDALTLQEGISRALWDRGTEDRHYDRSGPFVPLARRHVPRPDDQRGAGN